MTNVRTRRAATAAVEVSATSHSSRRRDKQLPSRDPGESPSLTVVDRDEASGAPVAEQLTHSNSETDEFRSSSLRGSSSPSNGESSSSLATSSDTERRWRKHRQRPGSTLPAEHAQAIAIKTRKAFTTTSGLFEAVVSGEASLPNGTDTVAVSHFALGELFLSCSSFYPDLFDEAELRTEGADVLCGSVVNRADEEGVPINPLSPLLSSLCMQINHDRTELEHTLIARFKETKTYLALSTSAVESEAKELIAMGDSLTRDEKQIFRLATSARFRRFETLRLNLSGFIKRQCRHKDLSLVAKETVPLFCSWGQVMITSPVRTLRHTGTFIYGQLAVSLLEALREARDLASRLALDILNEVGPMGSKTRRTRGEQQIQELLEAIARIVDQLIEECLPKLKDRANDVSWHIQYEAVAWMNVVACEMPAAMLLVEPDIYHSVWQSASVHRNPEVRRLAMLGVQRTIEALTSLIQVQAGVPSRDSIFSFSSEPGGVEPLAQLENPTIEALVGYLTSKIPVATDPRGHLSQLIGSFMTQSAVHTQDPDIFVAVVAADNLRAIIRFESAVTPIVPEFSLSEPIVTRAVSCLVFVDSPFLNEPIARTVDAALFASSIIRDNESASLSPPRVGETPVAARPATPPPSASAIRVASSLSEQGLKITVAETNRLVMDLTTVCEFISDYATGHGWQERHQQIIKAFWCCAPIMKQWSFIGEMLCLQLGRRPVATVGATSAATGAHRGREPGIEFERNFAAAQLTILLGGMEVQREQLGGATRYLTLEANKNIESTFRFRGYRLTTQPGPLWNLEKAKPAAIEEMARRTVPLWRFITPVLDGSRGENDVLLMALSLAYELLDATATLIEQRFLEIRHLINLSLIHRECGTLLTLVLQVIEAVPDRQIQNASFAVLHALRAQYARLNTRHLESLRVAREQAGAGVDQLAAPPDKRHLSETVADGGELAESDEEFKELLAGSRHLKIKIDKFFETWGSQLLSTVTENIGDHASLRGHLNRLVAAGQHSTANVFRNGLECLDEIIGVIEQKHLELSELKPNGPSDSLTLLCLDTVWTALACWGAQIERRFFEHIKPQIAELVGAGSGTGGSSVAVEGSLAAAARSASEQPQRDVKTVLGLNERLRILKEDLDIFRELSTQLISFCQGCSVGWRSIFQKAGFDTKEGEEDTDMGVKLTTNATLEKSAVVSAVAAAKTIIHVFSISLGNTLWHSIEHSMAKLLDPGLELDHVNQIIDLTRACRDPSRADSSLEVARLLDNLKLVGREYRNKLDVENVKEQLAQVLPLGISSVNGFAGPSSIPSPTGPVSIIAMYIQAVSEQAAEAVLTSFPDISETATCLQIDLLAAVTQCPDPSLWKDGAVGQVILYGFSSRSAVYHELAIYFMEHVIQYETVQWNEARKLAEKSGHPVGVIKSPLLEMIVGTIHQSLDRQRSRSAKEARSIADRCGDILAKHKFFRDVPPSAIANFAEQSLFLVLEEVMAVDAADVPLASETEIQEHMPASSGEQAIQQEEPSRTRIFHVNTTLLTLLTNEVMKTKVTRKKDQEELQVEFERIYRKVRQSTPPNVHKKFFDTTLKFLFKCFPGVTARRLHDIS